MADQKLTALTEDTAPASTDYAYTVKDPGGTPLSRRATWLNILKGAALGVLTSDGDLFTRTSGALARLTRASLAADSAFTGAFAPLTWQGQHATVATDQSTSSSSYTDLATSGPAVTLTPPASGKVRIVITARVSAGTSPTTAWVGVALSGGNTVAANQNNALTGPAAARFSGSFDFVLTGLSSSSTTFTLKYRVDDAANTSFFSNRHIIVDPLP